MMDRETRWVRFSGYIPEKGGLKYTTVYRCRSAGEVLLNRRIEDLCGRVVKLAEDIRTLDRFYTYDDLCAMNWAEPEEGHEDELYIGRMNENGEYLCATLIWKEARA